MGSLTLNDYRARPHTTMMDYGDMSVSSLVASCVIYKKQLKDTEASPENSALWFYMGNAASAAVQMQVESNQPLTAGQQGVLNTYYAKMEEIGLRSFFYLFLICTREARHADLSVVKHSLAAKYGSDIGFFKNIPDSNTSIFTHLTSHPPAFTVKAFCNLLVDVFEQAGFSGGYGGKKWAACAKPLRDYVTGTISFEMLLDTVWTLAHNNGPIFNKGMLFGHYGSELIKILDVQRAGLIPNLVWHKDLSHYTTADQIHFMKQVRELIPNFGSDPVDWQKVQDLGAVGHYAKKVKTPSPIAPPKPPKVVDKTMLQILPNVYVKKISRAMVKA